MEKNIRFNAFRHQLHNAYVPRKYKFQATSSHLKDKIAEFRYLKPVFVFIYTISFSQFFVKQQ